MNYKEFFYFPKSDRSVLIVLLVLAVVVSLLLYGIGGKEETTELETVNVNGLGNAERDSSYVISSRRDAKFINEKAENSTEEYYYVEGEKVELFSFDPNTADSTELLRLGLRPWQVRNIYRYRAKGGVYREAKDFARLYGLTVKQFRELEPYIRISQDYQPASTLFAHDKPKKVRNDSSSVRVASMKLKDNERIDLGAVDTTMLKKVPGIGSYYAREIMRYGNRLGGFVSVKQLYEIEDLPEEVMKYFEIHHPNVRKMNVNKLTLRQLKNHPYLNFYQCRALLDYRRLKGRLKSMDDLRMMKEFTPHDIERLQPYVEF